MRRTFWAGLGYVFGVLSMIYAQKRIRRVVNKLPQRNLPPGVSAIRTGFVLNARSVIDRAKATVVELRDAATEGVDTMRLANTDLRAEFDPDPNLHRGPARGLGSKPDSSGGFRPRH